MTDPHEQGCPENEQAVGWALHTLEPEEEMALLGHLPRCSSCRAAARDAEQVLARLGSSVQQVDPPLSLRDRLMARVADTRQLSDETTAVLPAAAGPRPAPAAPTAGPASVGPAAGPPAAGPSAAGPSAVRPPAVEPPAAGPSAPPTDSTVPSMPAPSAPPADSTVPSMPAPSAPVPPPPSVPPTPVTPPGTPPPVPSPPPAHPSPAPPPPSAPPARPAVTGGPWGSRPGGAPGPRPTAPRPGGPRPGSGRPPPRPGSSPRGRRVLASALALIAVLAVGGLAVRTVVVEQQRDAQVAQAQAIAGLLQRLERPGTEYAILAREDGTAVAAVVASEEGREVFTTGLPANAVDRETYVLWGLRPGADPQPLGTFDVAATAGSTEPVASVSGESGFGQYAISREAGRTAPTAPSAVLAAGQVAA